jgi:hypothetical protein
VQPEETEPKDWTLPSEVSAALIGTSGHGGVRPAPQRDLHRPVLLHAGADAAPALDDDGRR